MKHYKHNILVERMETKIPTEASEYKDLYENLNNAIFEIKAEELYGNSGIDIRECTYKNYYNNFSTHYIWLISQPNSDLLQIAYLEIPVSETPFKTKEKMKNDNKIAAMKKFYENKYGDTSYTNMLIHRIYQNKVDVSNTKDLSVEFEFDFIYDNINRFSAKKVEDSVLKSIKSALISVDQKNDNIQ